MYTALDCLIEDHNSLRVRIVAAIKSLVGEGGNCGVKLDYDCFILPDRLLDGSMNYILINDEGALICKKSIEAEKWFYLSMIGIDNLLDVLEGLMKQLGKIKEE